MADHKQKNSFGSSAPALEMKPIGVDAVREVSPEKATNAQQSPDDDKAGTQGDMKDMYRMNKVRPSTQCLLDGIR